MTTLWRRNRFLKVTIWRLPFGGTLPGLAGRRFLVLIIKVTLSELSEASAPSIMKELELRLTVMQNHCTDDG